MAINIAKHVRFSVANEALHQVVRGEPAIASTNQVKARLVEVQVFLGSWRFQAVAEIHAALNAHGLEDVAEDFHIRLRKSLADH